MPALRNFLSRLTTEESGGQCLISCVGGTELTMERLLQPVLDTSGRIPVALQAIGFNCCDSICQSWSVHRYHGPVRGIVHPQVVKNGMQRHQTGRKEVDAQGG
jgi:hypothetical protein